MNNINYRKFEDTLFQECAAALENFIKSESNLKAYAFVFDCDEVHGSILASLETEDGLTRRINVYEEKYKKLYGDYGIDGICGYRYDVSGFSFRDFIDFSEDLGGFLDKFYEVRVGAMDEIDPNDDEAMDAQAEISHQHSENFIEVLVNVIKRLTPIFDKLDKTTGFMAYIHPHDISAQDTMKYMRMTVSDNVFFINFPELKEA